ALSVLAEAAARRPAERAGVAAAAGLSVSATLAPVVQAAAQDEPRAARAVGRLAVAADCGSWLPFSAPRGAAVGRRRLPHERAGLAAGGAGGASTRCSPVRLVMVTVLVVLLMTTVLWMLVKNTLLGGGGAT